MADDDSRTDRRINGRRRRSDQDTGREKMKLTIPIVIIILVFAWPPVFAAAEAGEGAKGSISLTAQVGLNTMVRIADRFAEPFDTMPFPLGAGLEVLLTDNIGIGGTVMYDQWSDYLGMFGGKWSFRLFRPTFDIAYHFRTSEIRSLGFFAGAELGYNFVSVSNMLGNVYEGNLKSEPHLAPFAGINIHFRRDSAGFLGRLAVTFKAAWSVTGRFAGVYGLAGLTLRI
jgi:hypothetical protein